MMMAVPTVVGGVLKLASIPPTETGRAATLKDIGAGPMAMTIIGSHELRVSAAEVGLVTVAVLIGLFLPELTVGGTGPMIPYWPGH